LKNDEISIKEAIQRGILDRQRGVYIHPITKEFFSISDAINKGVIHARILLPPQEVPAFDSLVSSNRFQENRTYTICGAIDPRTRKPIGLSQAMRDGIINTQNGTYVDICTKETMTLNVAIERGLVLTELKTLDDQKPKNASPKISALKRELKTLTIEFVLDPRTNRKVSVTEAMHSGLLDRQTLHYRHPITNESLTLNRAYDKGFIIGHYTDSYFNQSKTTTKTTTTTTRTDERSYFIISVLDPRTNKSLNLEQAISMGLFDFTNALYINPINKEILHIHDAIQCGFVEAKINETLKDGHDDQGNYDKRLPIGDFGIDKTIKSMRTKFNTDGSSVLLIDIESTQPTRGDMFTTLFDCC
jgi:dystonin